VAGLAGLGFCKYNAMQCNVAVLDSDGLVPFFRIDIIDILQYRLLFGLFLLYTDRVPFELLDSAALL
jgi:hypothetical protein